MDCKEESSMVNTLITSSALKKDLLGDSSENETEKMTFDMIESQLTSNFYNTDLSNDKMDQFSNDKFVLVDFKTRLKEKSIKKLFQFFELPCDEESRDVLMGYVAGTVLKLHDVSSDFIPLFLNKNPEVITHLSKNIDNTSVSQLLVNLVVDNPFMKETDVSIKKSFCMSGTFEMAYSTVYTSKSRNELFQESCDSIFEDKMPDWSENLKKEKITLIQNEILDELKNLPQNLQKIKNVTKNIFEKILENFTSNSTNSLNSVAISYQIICKCIDLLLEHSNHEFPTCMNKYDKEDEEFFSIWETQTEEFFVGLFNNSEAKVSFDMFSKLMEELFNPEIYSNKLKNIIEFFNFTVFSKSSFLKYFELFLEEAYKSKAGNLINITSLDYLSRIIVISLHYESFNKSDQQDMIQIIIDNFSSLLELLENKDNPKQIIVEGTLEKPKLGSHRSFILKILIHCFLVKNKKFNLCVSTSDFKKNLLKLLKVFGSNDRFIHSFRQIVDSVFKSKNEILMTNLFSESDKVEILKILMQNEKANKFIILKLLKLFEEKFSLQCKEENEKPAKDEQENKIEEIQSLKNMKDFIYKKLSNEIKCYENLDKERKDRHQRKDTDSSMFSNNLLDDSEKFEANNLKNLIDSDPPKNDFHIELEEETESLEIDEIEEPVRRRKLSEDNIKLTNTIAKKQQNK